MYSLDKICELNNDCAENEFCDTQIGICACSNGFQLDDTKKFCMPTTSNVGLGLNMSGYDIDEINNIIPDQQQSDSYKKVIGKVVLYLCMSYLRNNFLNF